MKLQGVVVPIGTPLTEGDRVDEAGLRRLTRYLVDNRVNGILANGTMGGFAFLTDEEQIRCVATVVAEANGAIPVIGGLGETSTSRAVRKAKQIAREGVNYITVIPPFYFLATQEHLRAYFSEIAAAVDTPIFLYDQPALTKCNILPETIAELRRQIPHIVGVKVSNQDGYNMQTLLDLVKEDREFSVLAGTEFLIVVMLQLGCDGFVAGLHNITPQIAVDLYEGFCAGDIARARQRQRELIDAWGLFRCGNIWGGFDEALRYLGLCERATGAPYISKLTAEEAAKVHALVDRYVKPYLSASTGARGSQA